ncbi:MAG: Uma2 family endonuclease [Coleofasciculaceae cyanobacterium SM2_1_6]|nr:Uma2 family endonuclease [Coleofasciculaceae cyanobacterium SM2_1_6]
MVTQIQKPEQIIYPDSDGERMSENTEHFELIIWLVKNLELIFADRPQVFVIGDLLWYPVEGNNKLRLAPDGMVVFDRPKGYRGSYKQWEEANIPPQVVFEFLSPGNRLAEMIRKFSFYERYGVEEYYVYNSSTRELSGWIGGGGSLEEIPELQGWVSPRLGIRFEMTATGLEIYRPDGKPFRSFLELEQERQAAEARAEMAQQEAKVARQAAQAAQQEAEVARQSVQGFQQAIQEANQVAQAANQVAQEAMDLLEQERNLLEQERVRSQALADKLRELGIEPDIT